MNRRNFLKYSLATGGSLMLPGSPFAATSAVLDQVQLNTGIYLNNRPRTIMVFLYGGASELAGNFTNYDQFKNLSQSDYDSHFNNLNATTNGFWEPAGGTIMEGLLASGDLNVFRTIYSQVRDAAGNRSHGSCVAQNQRGSFNENTAGIFTTLAQVLKRKGVVDQSDVMPFLSMEGDSDFFAVGETWLDVFLRPLNINEHLDNPYKRSSTPSYSEAMDTLAQQMNKPGKIKDAFQMRAELEQFIDNIDNNVHDDLYDNHTFSRKLKTAINVMSQNQDTQVISTGSGGLGGWDDHNDADNYVSRMNQLFTSLQSAVNHLSIVDPNGHIHIVVMGDFGRGVNLNNANGWDHGNLQSVYVLGGKKYFNTPGVVGETVVDYGGSANRMFLKPASGSVWYEPNAIAATIYRAYGITNPHILTDNVSAISQLTG